METKTDLTVAKTIIQQLGHKCLYMIGAKKPYSVWADGVNFRIGRNLGRWSSISITLNGTDLYDVTFYRLRKHKITAEKTHTDIYFDGLHELIETETGMATSLGTMGG